MLIVELASNFFSIIGRWHLFMYLYVWGKNNLQISTKKDFSKKYIIWQLNHLWHICPTRKLVLYCKYKSVEGSPTQSTTTWWLDNTVEPRPSSLKGLCLIWLRCCVPKPIHKWRERKKGYIMGLIISSHYRSSIMKIIEQNKMV